MSKKVLIGNIAGPQGKQGEIGKQGEQGEQGERGIRGSRWTDGNRITGFNTEPSVYPTGLLDALQGDYYLNSENGNVYRCTKGGDDREALWVYIGNIRGAMPDVENVFTSTNKKNALSANAGRILYEKLVTAGVFPKELLISCDAPIYAVSVSIENKDTSITITDSDGNIGLYTYSKSGSEENAEVLIWIGAAIGLASGVILTSLKSTKAGVLGYKLYNANNEVALEYDSDVWVALLELMKGHMKQMSVTEEYGDDSATYDAYSFGKHTAGRRVEGFPISHAKAIWWNKLQNKTLYDKIMEGLFDSEQIIYTKEELMELDESAIGMFVPDAYLMGQLMNYVYNMPVIRTGTGEPDDSVGKDGDIYIMLESDE